MLKLMILIMMISATAHADNCTGPDATAQVQAAIDTGTCLAPGTYMIDMPPLVNGRRRDSMLTGTSICGAGASRTTIMFRGDASMLYWAGFTATTGAELHDVRLSAACVTNSPEQSHLVRLWSATDNIRLHDLIIENPRRSDGSEAGDCFNEVGAEPPYSSVNQVNHHLEIDHVIFNGCGRGGIHLARGVDDVNIHDNTFMGCAFDIGSESSGWADSSGVHRTVTNLRLSHNIFTSSTPGGYSLEMEWWGGTTLDHNFGDSRPLFSWYSDGLHFSYNDFTYRNVAAPTPVLDVQNTMHNFSSMYDTFTQYTNAAVMAVHPHDASYPSDFSNLMTTGATFTQYGAGDFTTLTNVAGFTSSNATLTYGGPTTRTPREMVTAGSSNVSTTGSVHVGF